MLDQQSAFVANLSAQILAQAEEGEDCQILRTSSCTGRISDVAYRDLSESERHTRLEALAHYIGILIGK